MQRQPLTHCIYVAFDVSPFCNRIIKRDFAGGELLQQGQSNRNLRISFRIHCSQAGKFSLPLHRYANGLVANRKLDFDVNITCAFRIKPQRKSVKPVLHR